MLAATIIIAVMYVCMCYGIAEMSPALPHTGGAYSFGRTAMGPWGGFITGLAENMEYVLTPAVIVVGIGGYMGSVCNDLTGINVPAPVWWLIFYAAFVGLNIHGVEVTFKFTVFITFLALGILAVFWIGALPHFSMDLALNIEPEPGNSRWLPKGAAGIAAALPFAIWFYLAIEQLPLASEESHVPRRDMPKGILYGILTLIIASFLTLFLNAGIALGAVSAAPADGRLSVRASICGTSLVWADFNAGRGLHCAAQLTLKLNQAGLRGVIGLHVDRHILNRSVGPTNDLAGTEVLKEQRPPGPACGRSGGGVRWVWAFNHSPS